jgi:hypothetical protein
MWIVEHMYHLGWSSRHLDPLWIYAELSHRACPQMCGLVNENCRNNVTQIIAKYILDRSIRRQTTGHHESLLDVAAQVKDISRWNSVMWGAVALLSRIPLQRRSVPLRYIKRKCKSQYHLFRKYWCV